MEFRLRPVPTLGGTRLMGRAFGNTRKLGLTDNCQHMIDNTTIRGHSQTAGAKGVLIRRLLVDHAAALRQKSTPAQTLTDALLALSSQVKKPRLLLADKGYDGDSFREALLSSRIMPVIQPKANRKNPPACDFRAYKDRNRIERMFNRPKQFRRIAA